MKSLQLRVWRNFISLFTRKTSTVRPKLKVMNEESALPAPLLSNWKEIVSISLICKLLSELIQYSVPLPERNFK